MNVWGRRLIALLVATLVTTALTSLGHSLFVQQGLSDLGVELPFGTRAGTVVRDFTGLLPALGAVAFIALALGFLIASLLRRRWSVPTAIAFPLAGWAAMATALTLMRLFYGFAPLAGARSLLGFLVLSAAGLVGGMVYAWMARTPMERRKA
jgi:hypothetical protein